MQKTQHDNFTFVLVVKTMGNGQYITEESSQFIAECDVDSVDFISKTIEETIVYEINGEIPYFEFDEFESQS